MEDISPDMGALSLSSTRESVCFIDPFRDDPSSEDNTDPDSENDKSSEEGGATLFFLKFLCFYLLSPDASDMFELSFCTCKKCTVMPTAVESLCCQTASRMRLELMTG